MVELLAPAGSYESLCAACKCRSGCGISGRQQAFGARAYADNPGEEALLRGQSITAICMEKNCI